MDIAKYSGSPYIYDFKNLHLQATEDDVASYCSNTRQRFAQIAREFSDERNTRWVVRHYLAVKYIFAATLILTSAEYGEERNIRVSLPYSSYYGLLYCCRAFLFTTPDFEWKGLTSIEKTHQSILNSTINFLGRLSSDGAKSWGRTLKSAQSQRELFSYRFPATGPDFLGPDFIKLDDAITLCQTLTDLSQLNSDCLESALSRYAPGTFRIAEHEDLLLPIMYDIGGPLTADRDDAYRIGWLSRKSTKVTNLAFMATEGLVEDFFGAWCSEEEKDEVFDPDDCWDLLLSL